MSNIEQTLSIIKPDAVERNLDNEIKEMFTDKGFKIIKDKKIQITKAEAEQFYKVHETKPFYNDLCAYLSSGPIVVMVLEKENAVLGNRELMGATKPEDAAEGTIRKKYGISIDKNSVHGSDSVENAKIAFLDFNITKHRMQMGVEILLNNPGEAEKIMQREKDITKERIQKLLSAGANVFLTTKGCDDMALKYFVEAKAIAIRRVNIQDMKRLAKATGGKILKSLSDMEGEETIDPACLGTAREVVEEKVGDGELTYIKGCENKRAATIVLRGANEFMLDEMDRSLHDALMIVKRMLESNTLTVGGGAVEAALSIYLENFATSLGSREQLAISEFAEALLVIPRTLAVNAAQDATELVAKLRAYHHKSQTKEDCGDLKWMGLDLINGVVRDNMKAGVVEPAISKVKSIRFATEAAITILRIDDMIKLNPPQQQQ